MKTTYLLLILLFSLHCFAQYEGQPTLNIGWGTSSGRFNNGIFKAQYDPNQGKPVITSIATNYNTTLYPVEIEYLSKNVLINTGVWIPTGQDNDFYSKVSIAPVFKLEMAFGGYVSRFGFFAGFHYFGTSIKAKAKDDLDVWKNYGGTVPNGITSPVQITSNHTTAKYYYINKMGLNEQGLNAHICIGEKILKKFSYYINLTSTSAKTMDIDKKGRGIGHVFEFSSTIPFNKTKDWGLFCRIGHRINNTSQLVIEDKYFPSTRITQSYFMIGLFLPASILSACSAESTSWDINSSDRRDNPIKRWGESWYEYNKNRK